MFGTALVLQLLFAFICISPITSKLPRSCRRLQKGLKIQDIPCTHLFNKKQKPIIIAKRGNTKLFQENTKEGILSAVNDLQVDAVELDVQKTKDDKLIVFNDASTKRLTGVDKLVADSTYAELLELDIMKYIHSETGQKSFHYDCTRKIPLLEDVLAETRKLNVVHFLEIHPFLPFTTSFGDALKTGQLVAQLITKMNVFDQVFVISSDFRKLAAVKSANPKITVGPLFGSLGETIPKALYVNLFASAAEFSRMSGIPNPFEVLQQCISDAPDSNEEFYEFVLNYGVIFKAIGGSFIGLDFPAYNIEKKNRKKNTLRILRRNYGKNINAGVGTMYDFGNTEAQNADDERKLKVLLADGDTLGRILTDDVPRLRKLLCR